MFKKYKTKLLCNILAVALTSPAYAGVVPAGQLPPAGTANSKSVLCTSAGSGNSRLCSMATILTAYPTATFNGSTASAASINIPHGNAPTTCNTGDLWTTTSGMYICIAGVATKVSGSSTVSATTPTGLSVAAGGVVTWNANAGTNQNITGYTLYEVLGANASFTGATTIYTGTGTTYTDPNASSNQYTYFITDTNSLGTSPVSSGVNGPAIVAGPPTSDVSNPTGFILTWTTSSLISESQGNTYIIDGGVYPITYTTTDTFSSATTTGSAGISINGGTATATGTINNSTDTINLTVNATNAGVRETTTDHVTYTFTDALGRTLSWTMVVTENSCCS